MKERDWLDAAKGFWHEHDADGTSAAALIGILEELRRLNDHLEGSAALGPTKLPADLDPIKVVIAG